MKSKDSLLFVVGPPNTATSTMVGMLNCHPEIFILYEVNMAAERISGYGRQLIGRFPEAEPLFQTPDDMPIKYENLRRLLGKKGAGYRYFGDKFAALDRDLFEKLNPHRIILTSRNVRTWLCKRGAIKNFRTDRDLVGPALAYVSFLIDSFRLDRCLRIRLEDFVADNKRSIRSISGFLKIDFSHWVENWWDRVGAWSKSDPKSALKWFDSTHASSFIRPRVLDTVSEPADHPFWEELLPIFDKYYANLDRRFDPCELNRDLDLLARLSRHAPLPLGKGYRKIVSASLARENLARGRIIEKNRIVYDRCRRIG